MATPHPSSTVGRAVMGTEGREEKRNYWDGQSLEATSNKCIPSSNKCLTSSNKKLVETI